MKKLLTILFVFATLCSKAQTWQYVTNPGNTGRVRGNILTDSAQFFSNHMPSVASYLQGYPGFVVVGDTAFRWSPTAHNFVPILSSGAPVWGTITGTMSAQTDLQAALNFKQNKLPAGTTTQYYDGTLALRTLSTSVWSTIDTTSKTATQWWVKHLIDTFHLTEVDPHQTNSATLTIPTPGTLLFTGFKADGNTYTASVNLDSLLGGSATLAGRGLHYTGNTLHLGSSTPSDSAIYISTGEQDFDMYNSGTSPGHFHFDDKTTGGLFSVGFNNTYADITDGEINLHNGSYGFLDMNDTRMFLGYGDYAKILIHSNNVIDISADSISISAPLLPTSVWTTGNATSTTDFLLSDRTSSINPDVGYIKHINADQVMPRHMTTTVRDSYTAFEGQVIYNTTAHTYQYWNGSSWTTY